MISVEQASQTIHERLFQPQTESVSLADALNRICTETICADRDFPPFDRVAMDGICIQFNDFENGQRRFKLLGTQPAGAPALNNQNG